MYDSKHNTANKLKINYSSVNHRVLINYVSLHFAYHKADRVSQVQLHIVNRKDSQDFK